MPNVVHVSACVLQESISLTFVKASLHFSINLLVTNRQKKLREYINKPRCFRSVSRRTFLDEQEIDE